jgi:exonuclease III
VVLVSWNVAGRKSRLDDQAERVLELAPDLVCLQEVTPVTAGPWSQRLTEAGLVPALAPLPRTREGSRPLAVLTAARSPLELVQVDDVPWAERVLAVRADGLEIVNVHSPISPKPGLVKVRTHEAVFRRRLPPGPPDRLGRRSVTTCSYRHDWRREDKLSDHSALVAELHVERPGRR